jgi:predicted heme/steroid binding protein
MERRISRKELQANNGEPGRRRYIAFDGVVYDVSDCPNWRTELHRGQHFAGQDLTAEIHAAPHGEETLQRPCVRRVGLLIGDDRPPLT